MILTHLQGWLLDDNACRCILVEVQAFNGQEEVTLYLSNRNYITTKDEVPEHTAYLPCITEVAPLIEKMDIDGAASLSLGEISLSNHAGDITDWLGWIFDNRPIKVFIGDLNWPRSQFEVIYEGIVATLQVKSNELFALPVTDKLQRLNGAINEELDDADETLPMCFGEVSNIKPKLIDPVNLRYQVHTRKISGIIEVRDRGLPVNFSVNVDEATFQLGSKPFGEVTCSVWGDTNPHYHDTPTEIIKQIVTGFGPEPLTPEELDNESLDEFALKTNKCIGVYIDERSNILNVIREIAFSVGGSVCTSADGKLRLIQVEAPETLQYVMELDENNIAENSFRILSKLDVMTSLKLGYNRNYAPDSELSVGMPTEHQKQFDGEWKYVKVKDDSLIALYRHTEEPVPQYTHLQVRSEALAECQRWFDIFKTQRFIFSIEGYEELLQLELGDVIHLLHRKFGFHNGRNAMVIGLAKNWSNGTVRVEFLA